MRSAEVGYSRAMLTEEAVVWILLQGTETQEPVFSVSIYIHLLWRRIIGRYLCLYVLKVGSIVGLNTAALRLLSSTERTPTSVSEAEGHDRCEVPSFRRANVSWESSAHLVQVDAAGKEQLGV